MSDIEPIVQTTNLVKIFRDFWQRPKVKAVDGVNLKIYPGEIFGLLGPNGSGKSTIIKMLLGLLHQTSGSISVCGKAPSSVSAKQQIGYLPEESHLYGYLTPRETLTFYGRLFDLDKREITSRVEQLLEMTGLAHTADRPVGEFSKGMARRTGLAQALINNPSLIILDEPTSGLDPMACRQVKDTILGLAKSGKTILLSSHLLADVEDVCDRIAILYSGKVRAMGKVDELLEKKELVRFTLEKTSDENIKNIAQLLNNNTGKEPLIDHPSMNLESFFLEVVDQAHLDTPLPSGASKSSGMAPFLTETTKEYSAK